MTELSITTAARLSGKSVATVRRWAAQKIIPARKAEDGRWVFDQDHLTKYLRDHGPEMSDAGTIRTKAYRQSEKPLIDAYAAQIRTIEGTLERERRLNDELRGQLNTAQGEIFKLTQEIKALLSKDIKTSPARWIKTKIQDAFA